ncbi:hypothetical protein NFI96_010941 [Prochilodus magdalenae]|nr:hypothetical protein NFI96_010941 [Prochilodus magdalenae]
MKLSSTRNLLLPDTHEILLQQVKDELVRKGLPENITLHLKSISKEKEVKLDTQKNGT